MNIVIIGSGVAGITFAEKMQQVSNVNISLLTTENYGYYSRPLLSRGFSQSDIEQSIIIKPFNALRDKSIQLVENVAVTTINCAQQYVEVQGGGNNKKFSYDKLIIATGSAAFIPPPFVPYHDNFFLFNSLHDLKELRRLRESVLCRKQEFKWAIIGGGLIGCELASDMAVAGDKVCLLHAMDRLMERQLVVEDSDGLLAVMQGHAIEVKFNQLIQSITAVNSQIAIKSQNFQSVFDAVIVACGFAPRIELAQQAGLDTNRGILLNASLQTSDPHIFALGDVAELPNNKLYPYILPIRKQAIWLAEFLSGQQADNAWQVPDFAPKAKVHGFVAAHPYCF